MTTKSHRLSVSLRPKTAKFISKLAKKEHKSASLLAQELIDEALDLREDLYLSKIADEVEKRAKGKPRIPFDDVWKQIASESSL